MDLVLQPLDAWQGFVRIEQIGGSALRYQLNMIAYALSMAQRTRTPAFTGYLAEGQRNAITKMCDKKVWGYWAYEQLIGYGRWNPDPIARDNVMYSGYFGVMIGLYETLNEDRRFDAAGSLPLVWNRKTRYDYDFFRLADAVRHNMAMRGDSPQFPCEPHLVYPTCNTFALNTLLLYDRLHDDSLLGDLVEKVRVSYDRDGWRTPTGRFLSGRTERSGRFVMGPAIANDAFVAYWLHASMPELARRTYEMVLERFLRHNGDRVDLPPVKRPRLDLGNYSREHGEGFTQAMAMLAAREMGDEQTARGLERAMEIDYPFVEREGVIRHPGVSTLTNAVAALGRFGGANAMRDLLLGNVPAHFREGPVLAEAAYPEVLVARTENDRNSLDLVLRPGAGPCRTSLGFERLQPGATYRVQGAPTQQLTADANGRAVLEVELNGRTEIALRG